MIAAQIKDLKIGKRLNDGNIVDFVMPYVEFRDAVESRRSRPR